MSTNPFDAPGLSGGAKPQGPDDDGYEYLPASSWSRMGAYLIDSCFWFVGMLAAFFAVIFVLAVVSPESADTLLAEDNPVVDLTGRAMGFLLPAVYGTVFEASPWMATPGKKLLGLVVVTEVHSRPLDLAEAAKRNFTKSLMLSCCGLLASTAIDGRQGVWNDTSGHKVLRRVAV